MSSLVYKEKYSSKAEEEQAIIRQKKNAQETKAWIRRLNNKAIKLQAKTK